MKLKEGLIISKINDGYVLVDSSALNDRFNGIIKLNEATKNIIEQFMNDTSIDDVVNKLLDEYDTTYDILYKDVSNVVEQLESINLFDYNNTI